MSGPAVDLDVAFAALADSTRLAVIRELLHEPLRAGELAARVAASPPALSRHLRVLRRAGLIVEDGVEHDARVRIYTIDLDAFNPVRHWLDEIEARWHEQLASFKQYAERSRGADAAPVAPAGAPRGSQRHARGGRKRTSTSRRGRQ